MTQSRFGAKSAKNNKEKKNKLVMLRNVFFGNKQLTS